MTLPERLFESAPGVRCHTRLLTASTRESECMPIHAWLPQDSCSMPFSNSLLQISSLRIELKAFWKSSFRTALPVSRLSRYSFASQHGLCTISSSIIIIDQLSGASRTAISSTTFLPATLTTRRRRVQPTVIGWTLFLLSC